MKSSHSPKINTRRSKLTAYKKTKNYILAFSNTYTLLLNWGNY